MVGFWVITLGGSVLVAVALAVALLRGGRIVPDAHPDLRLYRAQLAEVDRDMARGVLSPADANLVRTEVSRRLLDADRVARSAPVPDRQGPGRVAAAGVAVGVVLASVGLYWALGAPGETDQPRARRLAAAEQIRLTRPDQATLEAAMAQRSPTGQEAADDGTDALLDRLRRVVADRPDDLQGQAFLARGEASVGNFAAARRAQERVVALKGAGATAEDHAELADLMVVAAGGAVSPEAEAEMRLALKLDPSNGPARYYTGLLAAQTQRPDIAFQTWRRLLEDGPADAPWNPVIRDNIRQLAQAAGVDYTPPDTLPGPSADDLAAASDMAPEDQTAMIRGMVERLAGRLADQGGPPADWARLIRAYGVLGETDAARSIWAEAQLAFPDPADLAPVRQAAGAAGVLE